MRKLLNSYTAKLIYIFLIAALLTVNIFLVRTLHNINKQQQEDISAIREALEQLEEYAASGELDEGGKPYVYIELEQPKAGFNNAESLSDVLNIVQNQNAQASRDMSSQITLFAIIVSLVSLIIPVFNYIFLQKDHIKKLNDKFDKLELKMNNSINLSVDVTEAVVNPDEEIDDITPISDSRIDKASALYLKARLLFANDKNEEALNNINAAIDFQPNNAKYLVNRGRIYYKEGEYDKALKDMNRAINLDILNANSYWSRAEILEKQGESENALNDMTKAIDLDYDDAYYYWRRGLVYNKLTKHEEAIKDLTKAISLDSDKAQYFLYRAYIFEEIGEYDKALADINQAIDLQSDGLDLEAIKERIIKKLETE